MDHRDYIIQQVKKQVLALAPEARIILYGSRARGDARKDSDWDFLVIVDDKDYSFELKEKVWEAIYLLKFDLEEDISVFVKSRSHVWKFQLSPYYQHIQMEGIEV